MLVMVLVFGMMVVGCGPKEGKEEIYVVKVTNGTTFQVKSVVFSTGYEWSSNNPYKVVKSDPVGIPSNVTKDYEFTSGFNGEVTLIVALSLLQEVTTSCHVFAEAGKYKGEVLLSGRDYDSLAFNRVD